MRNFEQNIQQLVEELVAQLAATAPSDKCEISTKYFESPRQAATGEPAVYGTADSVRWLLRNRKTNGLLESGAVIERINNPDQKRAKLTIVHNKWIDWKATPRKHQTA